MIEKTPTYVKTPHPTFHTTPETPFVWDASKLYVVTCVINPNRYETRYHLYDKFEKMVIDAGAKLYTIEAAFGNRPYVVTTSNNPNHIQVRTSSELWHKENLLNIAISRLPSDWEYLGWLDSDISFVRSDWVNETLNQLQHYSIVQMFSIAQDLSPAFEPVSQHPGFMYKYKNHLLDEKLNITSYPDPYPTQKTKAYYAHPGYAWACRRKAMDDLGGLIDWAILGSADWHSAYALIGRMDETLDKRWSPTFIKWCKEWEARAEKYIQRNVGYVPGIVHHYWHGNKAKRRYNERYRILVDNNFEPELDLKKDSQGLWQLTDRSIALRDQIRDYFRSRSEDDISMD